MGPHTKESQLSPNAASLVTADVVELVQDCDEAIELDSKHVEALNRQAIALEKLECYQR